MELICCFSDFLGYTCEVVKFSKLLSSCETVIFSVGGYRPGKTKYDVKAFVVMYTPLGFFPKTLSVEFPSLVHVTVVGCGLTRIAMLNLVKLKNLEYLDLQGNNLTSLPDDLFAQNKKVRWIDFTKNKLGRMSSKLLKPIEASLEYVCFMRNQDIDDYFDSNGADNLERLMKIMDSLQPPPIEQPTQRPQEIAFHTTGEFTISGCLSPANAVEVFNLVADPSHQLKAAAFKIIQKMYPDIPDSMINNPDRVNRFVAAKREIEAILHEESIVTTGRNEETFVWVEPDSCL